jgi:hypothetical protein
LALRRRGDATRAGSRTVRKQAKVHHEDTKNTKQEIHGAPREAQ